MDMFSIGSAVVLNEWLGQRKGDIIALPPTCYSKGTIFRQQNKTHAEVLLPIDDVPQLKARLDLQLEHNRRLAVAPMVLFPQPSGLPYSEYWFTHKVAEIRDAVPGMRPLIFKDLRHTAVTRLAEAGATIPQIASITGHSFRTCEEIVDRYNIRTARMAKEGFRLRIAAGSST
jgi:integrase